MFRMSLPRHISLANRPAMFAHLLIFAAILTGCGKQDTSTPGSTTIPGEAAAGAADSTSAAAKQIDQQHPVVRIETNLGAITLRLDAENAPGTVRNFLNYVNEGFYKDTIFHFVVPGRMIVGGGYTSKHQLKPAGSSILNEANNGRKNVRGTIAMTRNPALIDSANSQFFINLEDAPLRDHTGETPETFGYCVFGEVTDGLDVAERISKAPTTNLSTTSPDLAETPQPPVVITAIQFVK
jgi:cyclophilin family peptidyl-prolyl cis-trans isomerase